MVLDSSAIVALHLNESGHERLAGKIDEAEVVVIGVPTMFETAMVLSGRLKRDARPVIRKFLRNLDAVIVPFGEEHLEAAMDAFLRYGRGRHPAGLNFGDCMAYATASVAEMPLLYTGLDFTRTDIEPA